MVLSILKGLLVFSGGTFLTYSLYRGSGPTDPFFGDILSAFTGGLIAWTAWALGTIFRHGLFRSKS